MLVVRYALLVNVFTIFAIDQFQTEVLIVLHVVRFVGPRMQYLDVHIFIFVLLVIQLFIGFSTANIDSVKMIFFHLVRQVFQRSASVTEHRIF